MVNTSDNPFDWAEAISVTAESPEETRRLGETLGRACVGSEVLLLHGDLGSGKTCFTQGLALGLGIDPGLRVTSPTFTLHSEYPGRLVLNHLDLYRLDDQNQVEGIGLSDLLYVPGTVLAVEWPELIVHETSPDCLAIRIEYAGEQVRVLSFLARGGRHVKLMERWRR